MNLIENNNQDYEICFSQAQMIEEIQKLLDCHDRILTIDGNQVFFTIKKGELKFKISIDKLDKDKDDGFFMTDL